MTIAGQRNKWHYSWHFGDVNDTTSGKARQQSICILVWHGIHKASLTCYRYRSLAPWAYPRSQTSGVTASFQENASTSHALLSSTPCEGRQASRSGDARGRTLTGRPSVPGKDEEVRKAAPFCSIMLHHEDSHVPWLDFINLVPLQGEDISFHGVLHVGREIL